MYNNKKISLIIPCYNERGGIKTLFLNKPSFIDEVIIVDNNSNDGTAEVAEKYGACVLYLKERGYGLACQKGLSAAQGDIIILMDGDNSYSLLETEKFLLRIEKIGYDFLTGCRFPLSDSGSMPFSKKIANQLISWLIRECFKIKLTDSQSGMFIFKKDILDKIITTNPRMGFSQLLKIKAWLNPCINSAELHISYQKRIGKVKFRSIIDAVMNLYDVFIFLLRTKLCL